jgi:hypothetical protein
LIFLSGEMRHGEVAHNDSGMSGGGWFKRTHGEAPWTGTCCYQLLQHRDDDRGIDSSLA